MLSQRYVYKSNLLRDRYVEGAIDYDKYISLLEEAKNEELSSVFLDREKREADIYDFESQQIQLIAINKEEKQKALERKKEAEEQKKKFEEEQERLKSLTPEQKLYIEREITIKMKYAMLSMNTKESPDDIEIFITGSNGASLLAQP